MFFIFHISKKYGVMVQNGAHTLKKHIWLVDIMNMESMSVVSNVYHDRKLQHLRYARRVAAMHGAHPPPVIA
jgi:hypothetical protein